MRRSAAPTSVPASGSCSRSARAIGSLRGRIERRVALSLGPVWEANHVWLIFTLVVLWTGFPAAFARDHGDAVPAAGAGRRRDRPPRVRVRFRPHLRRRRGPPRPRRLRGLVADHAVLPRLRRRRDRGRRRRGRWLRQRARLGRPAPDPGRRPVRRELRLHRLRLPARRLPAGRRRGARALLPATVDRRRGRDGDPRRSRARRAPRRRQADLRRPASTRACRS